MSTHPPNPSFANPLPVPPSFAKEEAARQLYVEGIRNDVYRSGVEGPFPPDASPKSIHWGWSLLVCLFILGVVVWIATDDWSREVPGAPVIVPAAEATGTLAEQVAELREEVATMREQMARIEGNVEARIDAYAMVEANRIVEEQQP